MADPLTLGVIAAVLVATVFEKSVDRAASAVVDSATDAGGRIIAWLRSNLGSKKELEVVAGAPDSKRSVDKLADVINAEIVDSDDVAELWSLVNAFKIQDPEVYQSAVGHHIVQAIDSTVNIRSAGWAE